MYKCKICGKDFELNEEGHYIARDTEKQTGAFAALVSHDNESKLYDTFDCPFCGCQNIIQERKRCESIRAAEYVEEDQAEDEEEKEEQTEAEEGKGCDSCRFESLEGAEYPCSNCSNNDEDLEELQWQPKENKFFRNCHNCKYLMLSHASEPCKSCSKCSNWEAENAEN